MQLSTLRPSPTAGTQDVQPSDLLVHTLLAAAPTLTLRRESGRVCALQRRAQGEVDTRKGTAESAEWHSSSTQHRRPGVHTLAHAERTRRRKTNNTHRTHSLPSPSPMPLSPRSATTSGECVCPLGWRERAAAPGACDAVCACLHLRPTLLSLHSRLLLSSLHLLHSHTHPPLLDKPPPSCGVFMNVTRDVVKCVTAFI